MKYAWTHRRHHKLLKHIATFYTYWAVGFHLLYWADLVPNTFVIATIVLVMSQIIFWIRPGHAYQHGHKLVRIINELVAHRLPFMLFIGLEHTAIGSHEILFAVLTILLYFLVHGHNAIYHYYLHFTDTIYHIRHT